MACHHDRLHNDQPADDVIPSDVNGPIRAVCYGVGIISTFIQSRMWGQGTLPHHRKASFAVQLMLQVFFSWAALFLIAAFPSSCSHCWATFPAEKNFRCWRLRLCCGGRRIA